MSGLLERLEALPDEFKEPLRAVVERAADTEALAIGAAAALEKARAELDGALAMGDIDAAIAAAARLTGCERVVAEVPTPVIERAAAADALSLAAHRVTEALMALPAPPAVHYFAELAAYRSLGPRVQLDPPVMLPGEREAQDAVEAIAPERERIASWAAGWRADSARDGIDPLGLLAGAAGLIEHVRAYGERLEAVAEQVAEVNLARRAAGANWTPPNGVMTPQIAAMGGR